MTTNTAAPAAPAEITNLREAKKAQAAARRAEAAAREAKATTPDVVDHDSGVTADEKPAAPAKIKWVRDAEKDEKGRAGQHGTGSNGVEYRISGAGDAWGAIAVGKDGKVEVLGENVSHGMAYQLCIGHAKGAQAAA